MLELEVARYNEKLENNRKRALESFISINNLKDDQDIICLDININIDEFIKNSNNHIHPSLTNATVGFLKTDIANNDVQRMNDNKDYIIELTPKKSIYYVAIDNNKLELELHSDNRCLGYNFIYHIDYKQKNINQFNICIYDHAIYLKYIIGNMKVREDSFAYSLNGKYNVGGCCEKEDTKTLTEILQHFPESAFISDILKNNIHANINASVIMSQKLDKDIALAGVLEIKDDQDNTNNSSLVFRSI